MPAGGSIAFSLSPTDPGYSSATGVYTISLAEHDDLMINASVTITGPGAGVLTIDGGQQSRIFKINGGSVNISGLAMVNAALDYTYSGDYAGTAINAANGSALTLSNASVTGCTGHYGQAVYGGESATVVINNSVISNNFSDGVDSQNALTIANSTISGNRGVGVGAYGGGTAVISGSTINSNQLGGIQATGGLTLTDSTLTGNTSYGAVNFQGSSAVISNCTIVGNSETATFYLPTTGPSPGGGGGILNFIYTYYGGSMTVTNSIIAGNTSGSSAQDIYTLYQPIASGGYNLIGTADGTEGFTATGDMTGTNAAPLDPKLGPLQNNGGPTLTFLPLTGSPAINAGNPSFNPATLPYDQRGYQRVAGGRLDIGAVESGNYINMPPVAVAGNPRSIHDTTKVTLNGSASYDDNNRAATKRSTGESDAPFGQGGRAAHFFGESR